MSAEFLVFNGLAKAMEDCLLFWVFFEVTDDFSLLVCFITDYLYLLLRLLLLAFLLYNNSYSQRLNLSKLFLFWQWRNEGIKLLACENCFSVMTISIRVVLYIVFGY